MKKYINLFMLCSFLVITSCDDRFEELNTDPNRPGADIFDPNLILPVATYGYGDMLTGYSGPILFQSMWIQALASTSTGGANYYSNADKYVISGSTNSYIQGVWNNGYTVASRLNQMQSLAELNGLTNLMGVGEIFKVSALSFVSDVYGDVPYSEGLQAEEGITQPEFDSQSQAYMAMLTDLEAALNALNPDADPIRNDVIYDGDLSKWRKFGYSVMLKMALRLGNVDPAAAETWVQKAVAGGVFDSTDDDALIPSDQANGYANQNANALNVVDDVYEVRWSDNMIDFLKSTNDPRLPIVAEVPPAGLSANRDGVIERKHDPAVQHWFTTVMPSTGGQFV